MVFFLRPGVFGVVFRAERQADVEVDFRLGLVRIDDNVVDQRPRHLARETAVCVPLLLDGFGQLLHTADTLVQVAARILQRGMLRLELSQLRVILFVAALELYFRKRAVQRQLEQLFLFVVDRADLLHELFQCRSVAARRRP